MPERTSHIEHIAKLKPPAFEVFRMEVPTLDCNLHKTGFGDNFVEAMRREVLFRHPLPLSSCLNQFAPLCTCSNPSIYAYT